MKELTTALLRVGTASALFGARQVSSLLSANQKDRGDQAAETLNNVAATLMGQFGEPWRDTFDVAEKMQREMVDSALRAVAGSVEANTDPMSGSLPGMMTQVVSRMGQMFSGFTQAADFGSDEKKRSPTGGWADASTGDEATNAGVF